MAMSLREVGAAIGVSFQQIQKYVQGDCSISAKRLWQLAGAAGLDQRPMSRGRCRNDSGL